MTFGEHLEELRVCLFKAIAGLVIGTAIGLYFGDTVVELIKAPLQRALGSYYMTKAEEDYKVWAADREIAGLPVPYSLEAIEKLIHKHKLLYEIRMAHPEQLLHELGLRPSSPAPAEQPAAPAKGPPADEPGTPADEPADAALEFDNFSIEQLKPIFLWHTVDTDDRVIPRSGNAQEPFMFWMKAGIVVGVILSSPWVFFQIWTFVAAGLYPHERKYIYIYLPFSLGLFLAGAMLAYLFVFDPVLTFFFSFNRSLGLGPEPRISEWMNFVLFLPLGFGVSFQLPLIMLFLNRLGIMSVEAYIAKWRISVLVIWVASAVLTPADPVSLPLMAGPLTLLYVGGIALCKWMPRGRSLLDA